MFEGDAQTLPLQPLQHHNLNLFLLSTLSVKLQTLLHLHHLHLLQTVLASASPRAFLALANLQTEHPHRFPSAVEPVVAAPHLSISLLLLQITTATHLPTWVRPTRTSQLMETASLDSRETCLTSHPQEAKAQPSSLCLLVVFLGTLQPVHPLLVQPLLLVLACLERVLRALLPARPQ